MVDAAGAIYVIGGIGSGGTYYQDVWVSADGGARPDLRGVVGRYTGGYYGATTGVLQECSEVLGGTTGYSGDSKGMLRGCWESTNGVLRG